MIKIILDTNILHQEGLNSTRFQILQRLIKSNAVSLIVPEIVIEEYKSKRVDQAHEDLKKIRSAIDNLHRKNILEKDSFTVRQFHDFVISSINLTDQAVESWLCENQVDVYPIAETSIEELFKSYFAGTGAFRSKKQREDIPDAVIYDCIVKLSQNEEILVVVKDGALRNAISTLDNVRTYESLPEILDLPALKEILAELNVGEKKVKSIIDTLATSDCRYDITEYLNENQLVKIEESYDENFIELPYEFDDIEINTCEVQIRNLQDIFIDSPTYLGNGKFSYTLLAECHASLSFHCGNDIYESLPYEYRKALSKSEVSGQSEVRVKGDVDVAFQGVLVLSGIDENTDSGQLKVHLSYLGAERSPIDCEINLEKLKVEEVY
ncbi:MAG: hypothetical protein D3904_06720 [Candidatus Electrothrix sp. EH2]|nr:hypothetical protein [Candidatus Electrothrix sp. EH2]